MINEQWRRLNNTAGTILSRVLEQTKQCLWMPQCSIKYDVNAARLFSGLWPQKTVCFPKGIYTLLEDRLILRSVVLLHCFSRF